MTIISTEVQETVAAATVVAVVAIAVNLDTHRSVVRCKPETVRVVMMSSILVAAVVTELMRVARVLLLAVKDQSNIWSCLMVSDQDMILINAEVVL
jgi:hypothetical protein